MRRNMAAAAAAAARMTNGVAEGGNIDPLLGALGRLFEDYF
jgi:hypothetical protein